MLRTHYSKELKPEKGVKIAGWVHDKRDLGSLLFVVIRDQTGMIQVTAKKNSMDEELFSQLSALKKENVVAISGDAVKNEKAPNGIEVVPYSLEVLPQSEELPIDMTDIYFFDIAKATIIRTFCCCLCI